MDNPEKIRAKIAQFLEQPIEALRDDIELTSLVSNSFLLVEMIIEMQEEFGVRFSQPDMAGVTTVGQLVTLFDERMASDA